MMTMVNNQNNFEGLEKGQQEVSTLFVCGSPFLALWQEKTSNTELVFALTRIIVF